MADMSQGINTGRVIESINNSAQDVSNTLLKNFQGVNKADEDLLDLGEELLDKVQNIIQSLDSFKEALDKKSQSADNGTEIPSSFNDLKNKATEAAGGIFGFGKQGTEGKGTSAKKEKSTTTGKVDIKDIKDLSVSQGLGFAIIYWKLDEISNKLGKGGGEEKKGKGIGKFFTGLLKGAAGLALIAVALIAFAGALNIFNTVEWGPALAGCASFAIFTLAMVGIAKIVGKEAITFMQFAVGATILSGALALFGLSLYIVGGVFSGQALTVAGVEILPAVNIGGAIGGIASFLVFTLACVGLSKLVHKNTRSFANFAKGAFFMAAALGVFGLSIGVVGTIMSGGNFLGISFPPGALLPALEGIGLFAIFATAVAGLSHLVSKEKKNWLNFAIGASLMSLALSVFALGVIIPSKVFSDGFTDPFFGITLQADPAGALIGIATFAIFALSMAALAKVVGTQISSYAKMLAATALMSLSLIGLSMAIGLVALTAAGGGGQIGPFVIDSNVSFGTAMAGLGLMVLFIAGFTALGIGIAAIFPIVMGAMGALLAVMGAVMLISLCLSGAVAIIKGGIITGEDGSKTPTEAISESEIKIFYKTINSFIDGLLTVNFIKAGLALANAVVLTPLSALIMAIAGCMNLAVKASQGIADLGGAAETVVLFAGLNIIIDQINQINFWAIAEANGKAYLLNPFCILITGIASTLTLTAKASQVVAAQGGVDWAMFDGFLGLAEQVSRCAEELGIAGAIATTIFATSFVPIINAIDSMVDLITKVSKFSPNGENNYMIDDAMIAIKRIAGGEDGKDGFIGMINMMSENMKFVGLRALANLPFIDDIADAIMSMANTVEVTSKIKSEDIEIGIQNSKILAKFISKITWTLGLFSPGKNILKKVKGISSLVLGKNEYEGIGLTQLVDGISDISKMGIGDTNGLKLALSNVVEGVNLFEDVSSKSIKKISKVGKAFKDMDLSKLNVGMEGFMTSMTDLTSLVNNIENSPFDTLASSINNANNSLLNINITLRETANRLENISKLSSKVSFLGIGDLTSSKSSSGLSSEKNNNMGLERITDNIYNTQKETKKSLEELLKLLKEWGNKGLKVNIDKNNFSI